MFQATSTNPPTEPVDPSPPPGRFARSLHRIGSALDAMFGLFCLIAILSILSVIPILNLLSLGYLLHASRCVARSGRWRDGFPGIRKISRLGGLTLGLSISVLPVWFVSGLWKDAELVAPGSSRAQAWHGWLIAIAILTVLHILWALRRGGRFRHFIWPAPLRLIQWIRGSECPGEDGESVLTPFSGLKLGELLWLGARAFLGTVVWLALPVGLLALAAQKAPDQGGALLSFLGAALLLPLVVHLPFLQVRFACENRFRALFELRSVRHLFARAPIAFWTALFVTVLSALPLYLLKVELPPSELRWLPALPFVVFMFPARLLTGWALGRAMRHPEPRHALGRWSSRLAMIPVALTYVTFVYLAQYLSWNGTRGLWEQHAFLVPAPWASL
jgi:hypothetical protein